MRQITVAQRREREALVPVLKKIADEHYNSVADMGRAAGLPEYRLQPLQGYMRGVNYLPAEEVALLKTFTEAAHPAVRPNGAISHAHSVRQKSHQPVENTVEALVAALRSKGFAVTLATPPT